METQFDISRIIGIRIHKERLSSYKWLPKKQKTWFFGLIRRNRWQDEGYYSNGCYQECYESGCWDIYPTSIETIKNYGYLVKENEKEVWNKSYVDVFLESEKKVTRYFETYEESLDWANALRTINGGNFEIFQSVK